MEPLKDFHKDEVRQIGEDLGLPEELVHRHPFPGKTLHMLILQKKTKKKLFFESIDIIN